MAGMRWFKVASDLMRHKKSQALARRLDDERAWAYVVQMWAWFCEQAGNGEQTGPDAAFQIARGAGWKGDVDEFCRHVVASGFLDVVAEGFKVHDWEEWAGAHVEYQKKDAVRKAAKRAKDKKSSGQPKGQSPVRPLDIPQTSTGHGSDIGVDSLSTLKSPVVASEGVQGEPDPSEARWPHVAAVLAALCDRGFECFWPSEEKRAIELEAAIRTAGIPEAVERVMAKVEADRAQKIEPTAYLGWHLDTIRGKGRKAKPSNVGDLGSEIHPWPSRLTAEEKTRARAELAALHPDLADAPLGATGVPGIHPVDAIADLNARWRAVAEARP